MENNIQYFEPGDLVTLNKQLPNAPIMMVVKKETSLIRNADQQKGVLRGIKCRWFTTTGELQEAMFNTKDLIKY